MISAGYDGVNLHLILSPQVNSMQCSSFQSSLSNSLVDRCNSLFSWRIARMLTLTCDSTSIYILMYPDWDILTYMNRLECYWGYYLTSSKRWTKSLKSQFWTKDDSLHRVHNGRYRLHSTVRSSTVLSPSAVCGGHVRRRMAATYILTSDVTSISLSFRGLTQRPLSPRDMGQAQSIGSRCRAALPPDRHLATPLENSRSSTDFPARGPTAPVLAQSQKIESVLKKVAARNWDVGRKSRTRSKWINL